VRVIPDDDQGGVGDVPVMRTKPRFFSAPPRVEPCDPFNSEVVCTAQIIVLFAKTNGLPAIVLPVVINDSVE
jgi:hypothetical protein